jgi:hypothetical protein
MFGARVGKLGVLMLIAIGCGNNAAPSGSYAETCQNSLCPQGAGAYKFCTSPRASACRYVGSDGTSYKCNSCSDCGSAVTSINSWCSGQSSGGGDCNTCSGAAQQSGGACSSQVSACQADSSCKTLASCLQGCNGDATCASNCNGQATPSSQNLLNNVLSCVCNTACTTQCASQCGGGGTTGSSTGGSTGGNTGGSTGGTGGTTGGMSACDTCQNNVLNTGGACEAPYNACGGDMACVTLANCLGGCSDMTCEQNCVTAAGQTALNEYNAIGDCICNSCASECASQCGGSTTGGTGGSTGGTGGTTGGTGGTTGGTGGTTGGTGGTTGGTGGTTGGTGGTTGGTTGGGGTCDMCVSTAETGTCSTEYSACHGSTGTTNCWKALTCAQTCAYGDTTCLQACINNLSSTSNTRYFNLVDCICTSACTSQCGSTESYCTPHS